MLAALKHTANSDNCQTHWTLLISIPEAGTGCPPVWRATASEAFSLHLRTIFIDRWRA